MIRVSSVHDSLELQSFFQFSCALFFRASAGQHELILIGDIVGDAVQHRHRVDAVVLDIALDAAQVIPGVKQVDLGEALSQEGGQTVGVGVPDQQQLGASVCSVSMTHRGWLPPRKEEYLSFSLR